MVAGIVTGTNRLPDWVTPEIAREMRDQVLAALAEAGYPDAWAIPYDSERNWGILGAPRDVIERAGDLVAMHWRIEKVRA
jgi:hypothetical protein